MKRLCYLSEVVDDDTERVFLHVGRLDPISRLQDLRTDSKLFNSGLNLFMKTQPIDQYPKKTLLISLTVYLLGF